MIYPEMYRLRQNFDAPKIDDVKAAVKQQLDEIHARNLVKPGATIAVTAGSRGIAGIDKILKQLIDSLKSYGANPFLFPAMGSHGGGTAEGQLEMLESLNITEQTMGAPILSSMEVTQIGTSSNGFPVYVDHHAAAADGIVVVNRIKPHTEFEGDIESGLMKMMAIGAGKHKGCFQVHKQTVNFGYSNIIPEIGQIILDKLPVLFGMGIVENLYDETALIEAVLPSNFRQSEARLLSRAKELMARLPFDEMDILIIDEMGKNISGTGMDTNVIGRIMFIGEKEPAKPAVTRIVVLGLTEQSHGNAIGIGLADYTTKHMIKELNPEAIATNAIAAMTPEKGRLPIALNSDQDAVNAAFDTIGAVSPENARVVHIKNTLELKEIHISKALTRKIKDNPGLVIKEKLGPLAFDENQCLAPVRLS